MLFIFSISGIFIILFVSFKSWEDKRQKITKISRFFSEKDYASRRFFQRFWVLWRSVKRSVKIFFLVEVPFITNRIIKNVGSKTQKKFHQIKDDIRGKYMASSKVSSQSKYLQEISKDKSFSVNSVSNKLSNSESNINPDIKQLSKTDLHSEDIDLESMNIGSILKDSRSPEIISVKELIAIKKITTHSGLKKTISGKLRKKELVNVPKVKRTRNKKISNDVLQSETSSNAILSKREINPELIIIEKIRTGNLDPILRAGLFTKLSNEFKFTHGQIAEKIGKSREHVSNTLRILLLPPVILEAVRKGKISEGHTRPLLMLQSRPQAQESLFKEIITGDLTVREAEKISRKIAIDKIRKHN